MINPYAQTFMIAARQDHVAPPRLRAAPETKPRRRFRLFRRAEDPTGVDLESIYGAARYQLRGDV